MFNVNGFKATLVQNNRTTTNDDYYDDQNKKEVELVEKIVLDNVEKYSMFDGINTNPGVIFYEGEITQEMLKEIGELTRIYGRYNS